MDVMPLVVALPGPHTAAAQSRNVLRIHIVLAQSPIATDGFEVRLRVDEVPKHDVIIEFDSVLAIEQVLVELRLAIRSALVAKTAVAIATLASYTRELKACGATFFR